MGIFLYRYEAVTRVPLQCLDRSFLPLAFLSTYLRWYRSLETVRSFHLCFPSSEISESIRSCAIGSWIRTTAAITAARLKAPRRK